MKKITNKQIARHMLVSRKKLLKIYKKRLRAKRKKLRAKRKQAKKISYQITAPKRIEINHKKLRTELLAFLEKFREFAYKKYIITLNFKYTESLDSAGMLLLLAETHRIKNILGDNCKILCKSSSTEIVQKVFQQIGFYELIGKSSNILITEEDKDVFHWKYASGIVIDASQAGEILHAIKDKIPQGFETIIAGVEEAMANSFEHAYAGDRKDSLTEFGQDKRWWVFAEVLDNWLFVVFCDLGIGIPRSLKKKWPELARDLIREKHKTDAAMITRALTFKRSSTEMENRGKGLQNIADAAKDLSGRLRIYSNYGAIQLNFAKNTNPPLEKRHFKDSILGTIITWSVPIQSTQDKSDEKND